MIIVLSSAVIAKTYSIAEKSFIDEIISSSMKLSLDLKSDFYIIPSFDDYESISESMRTAHYILKNNIKAKIIFVLNGAFIVDKTTKDEKIKEFQEHIEVNGFNRFPTLFLPKTALMRKLVDENTKKDDLKNKFEQNIKYKNVDKFVDNL